MIRDNFLVGVGPGNYAYWSPRYLGESLHNGPPDRFDHNELLVDHPHSEPLGLLAEYGLVGAACAVWMLIRVARGGFSAEWGGLLALLVFSLFNAPFHSAPHALTGLILAGCLLHQRRLPGSARSVWWFVIPAVCFAVFFAAVTFVPSVLLRKAEDVHLTGRPPFQFYARCISYPWPDATAQLKCGIAYLDARRYAEARRALLKAKTGTDTGEVYLALALVDARTGAIDRAKGWLEECFWRWPSSRDAWYVLLSVSDKSEREGILARASEWLGPEQMARLKSDLAKR